VKNIVKVISFFVLVILMSSCTSNKNSLTNESALQYLKQREAKSPNVFFRNMSGMHSFVRSENYFSQTTGDNLFKFYKKLYNEGFVKLELSDNPRLSMNPYQVVLTDKATPYINKEIKISTSVRTIEFNVLEVKDIRKKSNEKAEIDVLYKTTKTPFFDENRKPDKRSKLIFYPNGTCLNTFEFVKDPKTKTWKPKLIRF
jgi:hypothetical protein